MAGAAREEGTSAPPDRAERALRSAFGTILIILVAAILSIILYGILSSAWAKARAESARRGLSDALARARTPEELDAAVGPLGAVIRTDWGDWVAIAYDDDRHNPMASWALARDSGGGWFESRRHFCRAFSACLAGERPGAQAFRFPEAAFPRTLQGAQDLAGIRAILEAEGFRPVDPPPDVVVVRE